MHLIEGRSCVVIAIPTGEVIIPTPQVSLSKTVLLHSHCTNSNPQPTMAPSIIDLVNEYYEAKKPYSQMLREAHATLPSQNASPKTDTSTPESSDTAQSQPEPQFSISPRIPHAEIRDVLKKLEAAKIDCMQGDQSTAKASAGKKGKAPAGKK